MQYTSVLALHWQQRLMLPQSRLASDEEIDCVHVCDTQRIARAIPIPRRPALRQLVDGIPALNPRKQTQLSAEYNSIYFNSVSSQPCARS